MSRLVPQAELSSARKVSAFIDLHKTSGVLRAARQFNMNIWDVGYFKGQNKVNRVVFSTLEASAQSAYEPVLPEPFLGFAKAMLVCLHAIRPVVSLGQRLTALRCLEAALRYCGKGSRPTAVDPEVLDTAVEFSRSSYSSPVVYRIAGQLELVAAHMCDEGFIHLRQRWTHGLKKPTEHGSRISNEALVARQEKLPSAETLRALAGIFVTAVEPPDVLISSAAALMLCAPERINEVMRMKRNCLVEGDGEFVGKAGLRWPGSKGFGDTTKWLPSEMIQVAQKAVSNLMRVTAPGHELATWYTSYPNEVYLHEGAAHLRGREFLSPSEIGLLLWGDQGTRVAANYWASITHRLKKHLTSRGSLGYRFSDVESAILGMLPRSFPYMPGEPSLRCMDALWITRQNEPHSKKISYLCMFTVMDQNSITSAFGARKGRSTSIFSRFGFTEEDGSPIALRSHSLRHYLNMLAQTGGLSSTEIALFSGRKDQRQNRAYDHMTSLEVQAPITEALKAGFTSELDPGQSNKCLVARPEFRGLGIPAAHTTEFGWCHHNFASAPCHMYRDCINCEEHVCIKGEAHKQTNLQTLKLETEVLLKRAREALDEETYGADVWVSHQTKTLERVNSLLAIFNDSNVPPGARVRLDELNGKLVTVDPNSSRMITRRSRVKVSR